MGSVVSVFVRAQYSESNGSSSTPGGRIDNGVSSAGQVGGVKHGNARENNACGGYCFLR
jgi:hypothetical protein